MLILNSIQNYLYATFYLSLFKENENEGKLDWEIKEINLQKLDKKFEWVGADESEDRGECAVSQAEAGR